MKLVAGWSLLVDDKFSGKQKCPNWTVTVYRKSVSVSIERWSKSCSRHNLWAIVSLSTYLEDPLSHMHGYLAGKQPSKTYGCFLPSIASQTQTRGERKGNEWNYMLKFISIIRSFIWIEWLGEKIRDKEH